MPKSRFEEIGLEIGQLLNEKNAAYGSAFHKAGDFLTLLFPDGVPADRYVDMLCLVRIFDKMMRIATDKDAFGENPFRDITGYGILAVDLAERKKAVAAMGVVLEKIV